MAKLAIVALSIVLAGAGSGVGYVFAQRSDAMSPHPEQTSRTTTSTMGEWTITNGRSCDATTQVGRVITDVIVGKAGVSFTTDDMDEIHAMKPDPYIFVRTLGRWEKVAATTTEVHGGFQIWNLPLNTLRTKLNADGFALPVNRMGNREFRSPITGELFATLLRCFKP